MNGVLITTTPSARRTTFSNLRIIQDVIQVSFRWGQRHYKNHLIELYDFIKWQHREPDHLFGERVASSGALHFYLRVVMPCVLICGITPKRLVMKAEQGDGEAIEKLIRLDSRAMQLPPVDHWLHEVSGSLREIRRKQAAQWSQQGLNHGRKLESLKIKQLMGGLVWAISRALPSYLDVSTGKAKRHRINTTDIKELFDASLRDYSPANKRHNLVDEEIANMQQHSWSQAVRKHGRIWQELLGIREAPKSV